jgi:hypothetical protein
MENERVKAPGLKWRKRKRGPNVPYWVADRDAIAAGYPVKSVNLKLYADMPDVMQARCVRLHGEMTMWLAGIRNPIPAFDGTFATLIDIYQRDEESTYRLLKPGAKHPYDVYAAKLKQHVGARRIDLCDGRDVKKWFKIWAGVDDLRDPAARLPRARMVLTVLKASVAWGVACKLPGCKTFKSVLEELEFPAPKRREFAPTAEQVTAARRAAHAAGAPSRALAYALQFETTLRQWDVIGQWLPLSDPRPSALLRGNAKWVGPAWAAIDGDMIMRVTPTKTEGVTDVRGTFDLRLCPMVLEEMALIAPEQRIDALIVDERTGMPYIYAAFKDAWRRDFKAAGLPAKLWNRDFRAGASTEASKAGASREDRAKVAGHSYRIQATVYDRDTLEAHRRTQRARTKFRSDNDPGTG